MSRLENRHNAVDHYINAFAACERNGKKALATRTFTLNGSPTLLLVDPETLQTRVAPAACWRCQPTSDDDQAQTRFIGAVRHYSGETGKNLADGAYDNAGLTHGASGSFLTGDLCPTRKPLDRTMLELAKAQGAGTPVALAVSGLWIEGHAADFDWLRAQRRSGALNISWVNHSYRHPYNPNLPENRNYLRSGVFDMENEIFRVERLLIAHGETPSVFFRFPGLISDSALDADLARRHLIALGANAWLVFSPPLKPGSIILVHPNGNEPAGIKLFEKLLANSALPRPFRAIEQAP